MFQRFKVSKLIERNRALSICVGTSPQKIHAKMKARLWARNSGLGALLLAHGVPPSQEKNLFRRRVVRVRRRCAGAAHADGRGTEATHAGADRRAGIGIW